MSEPAATPPSEASRVLDLYAASTIILLLGIALMVYYSIALGPLTSPGAEESFGLAIALMALMGAGLFHIADRTYRSWPLGRKFSPTPPGAVTVRSQARFLKVVVIVLAAAAIAYLLGGLFT